MSNRGPERGDGGNTEEREPAYDLREVEETGEGDGVVREDPQVWVHISPFAPRQAE